MTDYLGETPDVTRTWCPQCEPDVDPLVELVVMHYCHRHERTREGTADASVEYTLLSSNEAGGALNAAFCQLLHRGRK